MNNHKEGARMSTSNNKGMSLIEVLVAMGLLLLIFVAVAQMIGHFSTTTQTFRRAVVRDNIHQRVARFSNLPQQLRNSIVTGPYTIPGLSSSYADNATLRNCIDPSGAADCTQGAWYSFTLVEGAGSAPLPVAGPTAANPVRYTSEGGRCDTAGVTCPIRVYTEFQPYCTTGTTCTAAFKLDIKYVIEQDPGVTLNPPIRTITNDQTAVNPQPMLSVAIPLAAQYSGASINAIAFWSSTTDLATSNLYNQATGAGGKGVFEIVPLTGTLTGISPTLLSVDGAIRPGSGNLETCDNTIIGAIRRDNATDSLQICTLGTTAGTYVWKWIGGAAAPTAATGGSGASTGGTAKFPYLPNLYLCPGGGTIACGAVPPCVNQVTNYANCCMSAGVTPACSELR